MHHGLPGSTGIFYTFEGEAKRSFFQNFCLHFRRLTSFFLHFSDAKKCHHPTAALKYDVFSSCLMFFLLMVCSISIRFFLVLFVSLTGLRRGIAYIHIPNLCTYT